MSADQSRMYDLGRQANKAGYNTACCNLSISDPLRAWWLAGWHDNDIESKQERAA